MQHLDAGVEQVDTLRDLEITSRCVVEWSQVRVRLGDIGEHREAGKSSASAHLYWSRQEPRTQNTSGASNTEPTVAMLARRRNTSPILRIITEGKMRENSKVDEE